MKKVTIMKPKYRAEDGALFDEKEDCVRYEKRMGLLPRAEQLHRQIQRMKALHGPVLAKSYKAYDEARRRAKAYLGGFLSVKSERCPASAMRLGRVLTEYGNAWQQYKNDLAGLRLLRKQYARAKAEEKENANAND